MEAGLTAEAEDINDMEASDNTRTSQVAVGHDGDVNLEVTNLFLNYQIFSLFCYIYH